MIITTKRTRDTNGNSYISAYVGDRSRPVLRTYDGFHGAAGHGITALMAFRKLAREQKREGFDVGDNRPEPELRIVSYLLPTACSHDYMHEIETAAA